jgi:hypothetical protein
MERGQPKTAPDKDTRRHAVWLPLILAAVAFGYLLKSGLAGATKLPRHAPPPVPRSGPSLLLPESVLPGNYSHGDGLTGSTLTLSANHHFRFGTWTDEGGVILVSPDGKSSQVVGSTDPPPIEGDWRLVGDRVTLTPRRPYPDQHPFQLNLRFIPVQWGTRIYLVDENEMPGFCADAGSHRPMAVLRDQRDFSYYDYLKSANVRYPALPRDCRPLLPLRYRTFYDRGDNVLRVERDALQRRPGAETRIVLDRGSRDGVMPGMRLARLYNEPEKFGDPGYQSNAERGSADALVTQVSPQRSVAVLVTFPGVRPPDVRRGDRFTTGDYFNRPSGTGNP